MPVSAKRKSAAAMPSKKRTTAELASVEPAVNPPAVEPPVVEPPAIKVKPKRQRKTKGAPSEVSTVAPTEASVVTTASDASTVAAPGKKTATRKKKDVKKSTRTPSSYVIFSMEERKTIVANNPDLNLGEVSKRCGAAWKALSDEQKSIWVGKADVLKKKRMEEIAEENKNNPPKKKRSPSSYLLFAMNKRGAVLEENPGLSIGDISKKCGAMWKSMTDAEKQVWKDKAIAIKNAA